MNALAPVLVPPATRPHFSVARLTRNWYVGCTSRELRGRPLARTLLGIPMVLFRSATGASALVDRCPHRNVALSEGKVVEGQLQCAYHGWRFKGDGACAAVPGLIGDAGNETRCATSFPVREQDGFVWVWCDAESPPDREPYAIPGVGDPRYTVARLSLTMQASLLACLENQLDVPHTSFLHGGLFRTADKRNRITARVSRTVEGVDCEYIGEPRPTGLVGRVLAPGGGVVEHFDRFLMPSIGQVEYRLGDRGHIVSTQAMTPETDYVTRTYAVTAFRLPIPGWLIRPFLEPLFRRILAQDAWVLKRQADNARRFGGERHTNTEIDLIGPDIWYLLRRAERGELTDRASAEATREVQLDV